MKKYCKNCKWDLHYNNENICNYEKIKIIINKITGYNEIEIIESAHSVIMKKKSYFDEKVYDWEFQEILNKNNNCKYYKRKWYLFWVKDR